MLVLKHNEAAGFFEVDAATLLQVMDKIMETFRPEAVVLQCGADSVAGDRLGCFNLSLNGTNTVFEFLVSTAMRLGASFLPFWCVVCLKVIAKQCVTSAKPEFLPFFLGVAVIR